MGLKNEMESLLEIQYYIDVIWQESHMESSLKRHLVSLQMMSQLVILE